MFILLQTANSASLWKGVCLDRVRNVPSLDNVVCMHRLFIFYDRIWLVAGFVNASVASVDPIFSVAECIVIFRLVLKVKGRTAK